MAEQFDLERKWHEMKDLLLKALKELNGMSHLSFCWGWFCPKMNAHWVKTEMFDKANYLIDNYPADKKLVLCIGDPKDYTLDPLEEWENKNPNPKAVKNNLYIYTFHTTKINKDLDNGPVAGLTSGNKGLAIHKYKH